MKLNSKLESVARLGFICFIFGTISAVSYDFIYKKEDITLHKNSKGNKIISYQPKGLVKIPYLCDVKEMIPEKSMTLNLFYDKKSEVPIIYLEKMFIKLNPDYVGLIEKDKIQKFPYNCD